MSQLQVVLMFAICSAGIKHATQPYQLPCFNHRDSLVALSGVSTLNFEREPSSIVVTCVCVDAYCTKNSEACCSCRVLTCGSVHCCIRANSWYHCLCQLHASSKGLHCCCIVAYDALLSGAWKTNNIVGNCMPVTHASQATTPGALGTFHSEL